MAITLTDITTATFATLTNPPDGSDKPPHPSVECLTNLKACKAGTDRRAPIPWKKAFERNKDWDPVQLPLMRIPISWPFLKPPTLKSGKKGSVLNLSFVQEPAAGYRVKIYKVTYSTGPNLPPQLIAVAFPLEIDTSQPPKFLVHFKHIPGQAKPGQPGDELFRFFDPEGFDWLAFEIWNWLVYHVFPHPTIPGGLITDMPFLSEEPISFGFTYQLRQSRPYVLVLPQISRQFDPRTNQLLNYQLHSAENLRAILLQIQKDLFGGRPNVEEDQLSHVAISANSSGCNVVANFLFTNSRRLDSPAIKEFMTNEFNELFVFDPPPNAPAAIIDPAVRWRAIRGTRTPNKGKCVRFYTQAFIKELAGLSGGVQRFKQGEAGTWHSGDDLTSLIHLPFRVDATDVWQRTFEEFLPLSPLLINLKALTPKNKAIDAVAFFVHHVIFALCLADAASRSIYW